MYGALSGQNSITKNTPMMYLLLKVWVDRGTWIHYELRILRKLRWVTLRHPVRQMEQTEEIWKLIKASYYKHLKRA